MNLGFFIMGGLIFAVYIYFTIWNIFYGAKKQREENYPGYYDRHGSMGETTKYTNPSTFPEKTKRNKKRTVDEIRQVKDSVYKKPAK
tara:strand:+ start:240 stop:500 length:261 start_codon:yes stop_codon:yes gene_type:complete